MRLYVAFALALLFACDNAPKKNDLPPPPPPTTGATPSASAAAATYDPSQLLVFAPIAAKTEAVDDAVKAGQKAYFDPKLSKGKDVSCNSCHDVTKSGAGTDPVAIGTNKTKGTRNAPTIFNAAGASSQGWDGRSATLEDFLPTHIASPSVMDNADVKPDVTKAIATYVRRLTTPSRWDKFLGGDQSALTDEEKVGLAEFFNGNCMSCHAGKWLGAVQNQKLGLAKPWPNLTDEGRFLVTKQEVDKYVFKVPTLRNVTSTGPYLHDGSIASLDDTVKQMAKYQVGKELTDAQTKSIVAFLGALSGEAPKDLVKKP